MTDDVQQWQHSCDFWRESCNTALREKAQAEAEAAGLRTALEQAQARIDELEASRDELLLDRAMCGHYRVFTMPGVSLDGSETPCCMQCDRDCAQDRADKAEAEQAGLRTALTEAQESFVEYRKQLMQTTKDWLAAEKLAEKAEADQAGLRAQVQASQRLLKAAKAYDGAIQEAAAGGRQWVSGVRLDALYSEWIEAANALDALLSSVSLPQLQEDKDDLSRGEGE